jgi:quercetin dioxygenase-like cupin family protein
MEVQMQSMVNAVIRERDEGSAFWTMGMLSVRKLGSEESGGEAAVMEASFPPDVAPPLHVHTREAELNYVLEGEVTFRCGDEVKTCGPGGFVYLPKEVPHTFKVGPAGARVLFIVLPGGAERLYEEVGVPATRRELPGLPPNVARWLELSHSYGIRVVGGPLP